MGKGRIMTIGAEKRYPRRHYRPPTLQDEMLKTVLSARTPQEKRDAITRFNPHFFIFGTELGRKEEPCDEL